MKLIVKIAALILAVLFILPLGACGDATGSGDTTAAATEAAPATLDILVVDSDYVIVRPDNMGGDDLEAYKRFKNSISERIGYALPLDTDWDTKTDYSDAHEILFGTTNRPETVEALSKIEGAGYVITVINGKLVVAATSAKALDSAVSYFIENYLGDEIKPFAPDLLETGVEETDITSLTINDVKIQDFAIVTKNTKQYDLPIYTLTKFIQRYTGLSLSSYAEGSAPEGHKIIIGGTKADGSEYGQFETEIWYKDGNLHLGCANATMAQKTIYTFIDQYFNAAGAITIDIPADGSAQFHSTEADNWDDADPVDIISIQDRIVRSCYKCQAILELDHSFGKKFTYENHFYEYSIADARAKNNRTTNCVIVCNWVFMDANLFNHGIFNIVYDGTTGFQYEMGTDEGSAYKFCQENMQMIDMTSANMSVRGQYEDGELYPGDTLFFNGHMQTVLPHMNAFDAGRMNTVGVATSSPFNRWVGDELYPSLLIGFILRANDAQPE